MRSPYSDVFPALQEAVRCLLDAMPQCHGWDHTERVWRNARHITRVEGGDAAVAEYAALLHDIGRAAELDDRGQSCHAERGAEQVPDVLVRVGVRPDDPFIASVTDCVRTHRYRRRGHQQPESLEAQIVFDADKLDSMGAIGIGRAFHFAGRIGARVHNAEEEALASDSYSLQDTAFREYLVKLQHLHNAMLTGEGKRMAERRHRFMVRFFERLNLECQGEDY